MKQILLKLKQKQKKNLERQKWKKNTKLKVSKYIQAFYFLPVVALVLSCMNKGTVPDTCKLYDIFQNLGYEYVNNFF